MTAATVESTSATVNCATMEAAATTDSSAVESATYCTAAGTGCRPPGRRGGITGIGPSGTTR